MAIPFHPLAELFKRNVLFSRLGKVVRGMVWSVVSGVPVDKPAGWGRFTMGRGRVLGRLGGILCVLLSVTGCASEFSVLSTSGEPLLISRRGYSPGECTEKVKDDAARMGVTLRYIHIRGSAVGRSLLWPFEAGYACEAGIGPEQGPIGTYPSNPRILSRGS